VIALERVFNGEKATNAIRRKAGGNFADGSAVVVRVVVRVMFRSFGETIIVVRLVVGVLGDGRDSRFASCFANLVGRFVALIDLLIKARQRLTVGVTGADALRLQVTVFFAPIAPWVVGLGRGCGAITVTAEGVVAAWGWLWGVVSGRVGPVWSILTAGAVELWAVWLRSWLSTIFEHVAGCVSYEGRVIQQCGDGCQGCSFGLIL
jgi:hypothetical protein